MTTANLKGSPVKLSGDLPKVGDKAPDFKVVKQDLAEVSLADYTGKIKILVGVPSIDTPVCAKETREFNVKAASIPNAVVLVLSGDLPFAAKRFCAAEGIENVITGSEFRAQSFSKAYGVNITEGGLKGLSARVVIVVDKSDVVRYVELVPEITEEPNYNAALEAAKKLA